MSTLKTKNIQHPSASGPAIALNPNGTFTADIEDLSAESLHGGTFSLRNKLINGSFDIWQRGTTFSAAGYTADRWYTDQTVAKNRVFGPQGLIYGMSVAGACTLVQAIELPLVGKAGEFYNGSSWVLSWYSTTNTFTPAVEFRNAAVDAGGSAVTVGSPVAVETVGSWTRYKVEVTVDQDPLVDSECLVVLLTTSGASSISGIQFEKGGLTALEVRPVGMELSLCQRYYQKLYKSVVQLYAHTTSGRDFIFPQQTVSMRSNITFSGSPGNIIINSDYSNTNNVRQYGTSPATTDSVGTVYIKANYAPAASIGNPDAMAAWSTDVEFNADAEF